jgi:tetrapyrrole methylase family protein/MazG family protein
MNEIKLKNNPHSAEIAKRFEKLVDVMYTLRSEGGCPWDRSQTLKDLKQYLIEETYELLQALDLEEERGIREEVGDLLFETVFISQMMQEKNAFTLKEVLDHLLEKMIGRHPHVFADVPADSPEKALANWEAVKSQETENQGRKRKLLEGVPIDLPALLQAYLISTKVARVGFDWDSESDVWKKFNEELNEFREASTADAKEEEFGDVLFTLVNIARKNGINPEDALRNANRKFRKRFDKLEDQARGQKKEVKELSAEELDSIWEDVKKEV